jgi:Probable cobalt transporter subunit (CbtB)
MFNLDTLDKPDNYLYTCYLSIWIMSLNQEQKVISRGGVPVIAIGVLIVVALFSLFVVGYDTGQIFSIVQGKPAYDKMWLHEFVHDIRHESGFPCH